MKKIRSQVQVKFPGSYKYLDFFRFCWWSSDIASSYFFRPSKANDTNALRIICYAVAAIAIKHMCTLSE